MEFYNRFSVASSPEVMIQELTKDLKSEFDLGIIFFSQIAYADLKHIIQSLQKKITIKHFVGCSSAGVISTNQEAEQRPAITLTLANLPNVKITPLSFAQDELEKLKSKKDLYERLEVFPNEDPVFLFFPDPFLFDTNLLINLFNQSYPKAPILGGIASAGRQAHQNILIVDNDYANEGVVGVCLTGDLKVETVVSQGCRPIGETFIVTKAQANIIHELAGKKFLDVLEEIFKNLSEQDRLLAQEALFVGIAMDEYQFPYKRGDFLIRGLMGVDEKSGAGAIGDYIKSGQTIQFHVRDAQTATEDLHELLDHQQKNNQYSKPQGALVFSCNGRGVNLFKQPNHDINIIQKYLGNVAAGGFFCAGEIGPVGQINFIHGFTDSIALFYPKNK